jgi:alpha-beta hydrolase superfamily lysophospholipase
MDLQVEEGHFNGYDGSELFFQTWSKTSPAAVILGIHGLGEHSDCYNLLAEGLSESPFQLFMSDLRGHGRSTGSRGVGSIDDYVLDIKLFHSLVKNRFKNLPLYFLGHSMGGLILLKFLIRNGDLGASGAVLSSPLLGVYEKLAAFKQKSAGILSKITPNLTLSNEIPFEKLSHYKKVVESYANDPWRHDRISAKLFIGMLESMDYAFNQVDKIKLPILMQQSGDDMIVSQKRAEEFFEKLTMKDKTQIVYDGYYHEIYNEVWRDKPFTDLKKWLEKHLPENRA